MQAIIGLFSLSPNPIG